MRETALVKLVVFFMLLFLSDETIQRHAVMNPYIEEFRMSPMNSAETASIPSRVSERYNDECVDSLTYEQIDVIKKPHMLEKIWIFLEKRSVAIWFTIFSGIFILFILFIVLVFPIIRSDDYSKKYCPTILKYNPFRCMNKSPNTNAYTGVSVLAPIEEMPDIECFMHIKVPNIIPEKENIYPSAETSKTLQKAIIKKLTSNINSHLVQSIKSETVKVKNVGSTTKLLLAIVKYMHKNQPDSYNSLYDAFHYLKKPSL
ncbi:hypothetical protein NEFER03_1197 [Nematocida sp. LUAm3]|nr:hypothetical protein NEFER03_1197 [Nematocida sp. LUAm3]KAI5175806.1 hypothetical protein NEFER02_1675 [Nematocida sp. LUAm2]KAI5178302.1 hypothetical protein NEFER01_1469 [Nematocida sp. LUAm1]